MVKYVNFSGGYRKRFYAGHAGQEVLRQDRYAQWWKDYEKSMKYALIIDFKRQKMGTFQGYIPFGTVRVLWS
jgi:hypothetical protein